MCAKSLYEPRFDPTLAPSTRIRNPNSRSWRIVNERVLYKYTDVTTKPKRNKKTLVRGVLIVIVIGEEQKTRREDCERPCGDRHGYQLRDEKIQRSKKTRTSVNTKGFVWNAIGIRVVCGSTCTILPIR